MGELCYKIARSLRQKAIIQFSGAKSRHSHQQIFLIFATKQPLQGLDGTLIYKRDC